jgi:hypothetical protein
MQLLRWAASTRQAATTARITTTISSFRELDSLKRF